MLYFNNQVSKIIGITQRQVQHWTDKGVVIPAKDASRGGTKRGYNYLNLIEFGLVNDLYARGFGIQYIKEIIAIIRDRSTIEDWVDDHLSYFKNLYSTGGPFALTTDDLISKEFSGSIYRMMIEASTFEKKTGILFYFPSGTFHLHPCILPRMKLHGDQKVRNASHLIYTFLLQSGGVDLIDIGKIREDIDKKLVSV